MATGGGLCGWTDGRARQARAVSGELRTGIDGSGGGVAYDDDERAAGTSKAWQTDGRADGQADGPNRAKIALARCLKSRNG